MKSKYGFVICFLEMIATFLLAFLIDEPLFFILTFVSSIGMMLSLYNWNLEKLLERFG